MCPKQSATCNEKGCDAGRTTLDRTNDVPRHVPSHYHVTVIVALYVDYLRPDADSREQIPSSGAPDEALARDSVICESDPAGRKLSDCSRSVLPHRRFSDWWREHSERANGDPYECRGDRSVRRRRVPAPAERSCNHLALRAFARSGRLTLMTTEISCRRGKFSATEKQAESRSLASPQLHSAAEPGSGPGLAADVLLQSISNAALALTGHCGQ